LTGKITDPRDLEDLYAMPYPDLEGPKEQKPNTEMLVAPPESGDDIELIKGPNISSLPDFDPLPDEMRLEVLMKVGDNISTDEIMPAGQRVLPYRSNIPKISEFTFVQIDETYPKRAGAARGAHAVVGGSNYGQGSSREHAAIAPRYLGLHVVVAKNFARIHWQNLVNFGILPLEFTDELDLDSIEQGDVLVFEDLRASLVDGSREIAIENQSRGHGYALRHRLSPRQTKMILAGGLIPFFRKRLSRT
jgi:aconitate hydratase